MSHRILIITPVPTNPPVGGNRQRIREICRLLTEAGCKLDLFYAGFDDPGQNSFSFINGEILKHRPSDFKERSGYRFRIKELLNGVAIRAENLFRVFTDSADQRKYNQPLRSYRNSAKRALLAEQIKDRSYRAVIINYAPYSHYGDLFSPETKIIIDTHDRLSDRFRLFLDEGVAPPQWRSLSPADEKRALKQADRIWAITPSEQAWFQSLVQSKKIPVDFVPHLTGWNGSGFQAERRGVLWIGGKGEINVITLQRFLESVWSPLCEQVPGARLNVAGAICDIRDQLSGSDGVVWHGRFDSPETLYLNTAAAINPIPFGTGLKIKTLEALSHGVPVLASPEGAAGLERFEGIGLRILKTPDEWIDQLKLVFRDDQTPLTDRERLQCELEEMNRETRSTIFRSLELQNPG